jgi:predicted nucleotidyltransferase
MEKVVQRVINEIATKSKPISIFLYGSYTTGDYIARVSDLEIGVIRENESVRFVQLKKTASKFSSKKLNLRIYPYDLKKLKDGTVDTPFTKNVFIRRLILTSKTVYGKEVVENLSLPPITLLDAYREASVSTMRALNGILFLRNGLLKEGLEAAYKACLFATSSLEYAIGEFPIGFKEIVKISKRLDLKEEWCDLIQKSLKIRTGNLKLDEEKAMDFVFKVISYCNQVVEPRLLSELEKGNRIVVK